jgi:hypothetical protein
MKRNLSILATVTAIALSWLYLVGCAPITPPAAGSSCTSSGVTGVIGSDGNCWTCNSPSYAEYGYTAGYCGSENAAGVSCCSNNYVGSFNVSCYPSKPWLCSDGLCYSESNGNGSLYCVYDP